ncbi:MAG: class I SAM-dependent RNA methyltransferase [Clostridiales Family XIII bacterium]|jgi:putative N6-adenine-specific DNA methylase|nr:class I SAM-dependent RNA methyltransferase [Clostridiales Family XIII bacterium]
MKLELIATASFGLEAVVRREVEALGFPVTEREDGRITYVTNESGLVRSNLWLRCADRVLLKLGAFDAQTFEELFQGVRGLPWETLIPPDGHFVMNCSSVRSKLSSVPACQSVAEKALVERLRDVYGIDRFAKSGAKYNILLRILKDRVSVAVDTSGPGLHKRGYRTRQGEAPIKETLAAALVSLSFWQPGRLLADPLAGSGTIPIEAAMMARGIAPGLGRKFAAEAWSFVPPEIWKRERAAAYKSIDLAADVRILASDRDEAAVDVARENAENAGVGDCITFTRKTFAEFAASGEASENPRGILVTNPPYGERLGELPEAEALYKEIGAFLTAHRGWSLFLITTYKDFEKLALGRPADRRRKLYNGRLETTFYQVHGEKPKGKGDRK